MRCNPSRWLWGLIPIAMLSWGTYYRERPHVEADLAVRATEALRRAGQPWAKVTMNGRDAVITGRARKDGEPKAALDVVRGVWGIRTVQLKTDLAGVAAAPEGIGPYLKAARAAEKKAEEAAARKKAEQEAAALKARQEAEAAAALKAKQEAEAAAAAQKAREAAEAAAALKAKEEAEAAAAAQKARAEAEGEARRKAEEEAAETARKADAETAALEARREAEAAAQKAKEEAEALAAQKAKEEAESAAALKAREAAEAQRAKDEAEAAQKAKQEADMAAEAKADAEAQAARERKTTAETAACERRLAAAASEGIILFNRASADIDPKSSLTIAKLAEIIKTCPGARVEVEGHTDAEGTDERNQKLSERRARAVVKSLARAGVADERLSSVGYGASRPVAPNDTPEGMARNRRIEFKVFTD